MHMFIRLPRHGAIWFERTRIAYGAAMIRERGEFLIWLGRSHLIVTPPGWTAAKAFAAA